MSVRIELIHDRVILRVTRGPAPTFLLFGVGTAEVATYLIAVLVPAITPDHTSAAAPSVTLSTPPWASHRSASSAAMQPVPAAETACL